VSVIGTIRAALVADLAPLGIPVTPSWPDVLIPPCAFVVPPVANNYVSPGLTFGEYLIALDLVIMVDHADAADAMEALDTLLETALRNTVDWTLITVEGPSPAVVSENGSEYLAVLIHLSKPVRL
jgi:hypothetical protein